MATTAGKLVLDRWRGGAASRTGYLARGLSVTLATRLTAAGLSFATLVVLSRQLGPEGYGEYAFVMATVAILSPLVAVGMPSIVVREVAACRARADYARMTGVVVLAFVLALAAFLGLASAFWLLAPIASAWLPAGPTGDHLLLALALLLLGALAAPLGAIQQGLRRLVAAQVPVGIIQPAALLVLLVLAWRVLPRPIHVRDVMLLAVLAAGIALAVAAVLSHQAWRQARPRGAGGCRIDARPWASAGLSLAVLGVLGGLNGQADIVLLRWLAGTEATGMFHVATRNAYMLTLLLGALIMPLGPLVAELHAKGERAALQRIVRRSTRAVFLLTLPAALVMIAAGGRYLALFGAGFAEAHAALAILALAQLVGVGAGPVQMLLVMTGHQARIIPVIACSVLANLALNVALIPLLGATGAACATALSIVLWNVALSYEVRRRLSIDASVLGRPPRVAPCPPCRSPALPEAARPSAED